MYHTPNTSQVKKPPKTNSLLWKWRRLLYGCRSNKRATLTKLYGAVIKLGLKYKDIFASQETLADMANITREYANVLLHELDAHDLLRVNNHVFNSCTYDLPQELFFEERRSFENIFPVLKSLGLWLLMTTNMPSESVNLTQLFSNRDNFNIKYIHTIERGSYGVRKVGESLINCSDPKKRVVDMYIDKILVRIGADLALTPYGKIILSVFDEDILVKALEEYKCYKKEIKSPIHWIWKRAHTLSKEVNRVIKYEEMTLKIKAAGFKPGDRLFLSRDPESQPNFKEERPTKGKNGDIEQVEAPIKDETRHPQADKWLKRFPIPKHFENR